MTWTWIAVSTAGTIDTGTELYIEPSFHDNRISIDRSVSIFSRQLVTSSEQQKCL